MMRRDNEQTARRDFGNGRLETDESFSRIESYIRSEIITVRKDPAVGRDYLEKTGMYEKNGKLKSEFA